MMRTENRAIRILPMQPDPWESAKSSVGGCVSGGNKVKFAVHMALIFTPIE